MSNSVNENKRVRVTAHALACREAHAVGRSLPKYTGPSLVGADLSGVDARCANFSQVNLSEACLVEADLSGAVLLSANLSDSSLISANLNNATLSGANLRRANFERANLRSACLFDAKFNDVDFTHADLSGAYFKLSETDGGRVLSYATGYDGGYPWHALVFRGGVCILQYGCKRDSLEEWQTRGSEYGERYQHGLEHWDTGPAVAIAAAEALVASFPQREQYDPS